MKLLVGNIHVTNNHGTYIHLSLLLESAEVEVLVGCLSTGYVSVFHSIHSHTGVWLAGSDQGDCLNRVVIEKGLPGIRRQQSLINVK